MNEPIRPRTLLLASAVGAALLAAAPCSLAENQPPDVMARVGDVEISKEEVLEAAAAKLRELEQQRYEILRQTVDELVDQKLLEREADEAGQEVRDFLAAKLEPKVSEPSEEEIQSFYNSVKSRLGGRSLEQVRGQIVQKLQNDQRRAAYETLMEQLRADADLEVLIEPYRVEVSSDDDPFRGPADAPVTIIEFSDYQCPYCNRAEEVVDRVLEHYGDKVRVVFRDLPLENLHPEAPKAHEAAGCALEQDRFWAMHDKLFANRQNLDRESLVQYATELELDVEAFESCLDEGKRTEEVANDIEAARAHGISGTPAFFVNGRLLSGAQPFERFKEVIDDELTRQGVPLPSDPDRTPDASS